MKVVLTNQSLDRLEESLIFYLDEMKVPIEKVVEIKTKLLQRASELSEYPYRGQYEYYLRKLKKGHRRLIEGNFKIIYRVENDVVYVTDFFDSRRSPKKMKG
jgi:mRNA-degrading endonuclease RelE of RelBE toxin-antitoxin system